MLCERDGHLLTEPTSPTKDFGMDGTVTNFADYPTQYKGAPCGVGFECFSSTAGMDVHKECISVAVRNAAGKIVMECVIETKASTILQFFDGLRRSAGHL